MLRKLFVPFLFMGCVAVVTVLIAPVRCIASEPAIKLLVIDGEAAGDRLGQWISPLGDANNDGYDDFAVTAPLNNAGGTNAGSAYIYLGGPGLDVVPDLIFTGPEVGSWIFCAAPVGDVNDDGIDDFIIGARGEYRYKIGKAYLFFGSSTLDVVPDLVFVAEQVGDAFGCALSGLGDVNADGHDDFIIYAPWYNGSVGRGYLHFGGPGLDNIADLIFNNPKGSGEFGGTPSASFRGQDLNGDGYNDIFIPAYKSHFGASYSGGGWIYYGGPGLDAIPDITIGGEEYNDWLSMCAALGDMNGDGYEDFGMGAPMPYKPGGRGKAYIFLGGPAIDATADLILEGEAAGDCFGFISGIGDANLDGFPDVLVGAFRNDQAGTDAGKAYIYLGRDWPSFNGIADIELLGEAPGDGFGTYPAPLGDVDGDGRPEFAVAAMYSDANGTDAGRVYVYSINPGFTPWGRNVVVQPVDSATGTDPVTVTFDSVTVAGVTSLVITDKGPKPPTGFKMCSPSMYYQVTTSAVYMDSIEICIDYTGLDCGLEKKLVLDHYENGKWVSCTTFHDPVANIICGTVTSLSTFAVMVPVDITFDIKPGSCPNPFNITWLENGGQGNENEHAISKKGGVLPAALVGSDDFDVNDVDVSSLRLEGIEPLRTGYEDVSRPVTSDEDCACTTGGPDGTIDLTMKFSRLDVARLLGSAEHGDVVKLVLVGELLDGTPFEASDCVLILSKQPEPKEETDEDNVVQLLQAVPNPLNPSTRISFYLPGERAVTLEIFDSAGRSVARILEGDRMPKGWHTVEWHGIDNRGNAVASGLYFYRLRTEDAMISRKMILIR